MLAGIAAARRAASSAAMTVVVWASWSSASRRANEVVAVAPDRGRLRRARRIAEGLPEGSLRDAVERAYATSPEADS
jgi:phosphoribosylpyrophosphate synthetase